MDLRKVKPMLLRRQMLPLLLLTSLVLSLGACGKKDPQPPQNTTTPPPIETTPPPKEVPKEDPLAKASKDADEAAVLASVNRRDRAVEIVGAMEALSRKTDVAPTPRPRVVKPASGRIDPKAANQVFGKFDGGMQRCYERALKRAPGLQGRVQLRLLVDRNGKVRSANTRGVSMNNPVVSQCMVQLAKKMQFPKPTGGEAEINKLYAFKPQI